MSGGILNKRFQALAVAVVMSSFALFGSASFAASAATTGKTAANVKSAMKTASSKSAAASAAAKAKIPASAARKTPTPPPIAGFQKVVSPHAVTMNVLQKALTLADENDVTPAWHKGSLIQFMKDAGFKTFWISNQEEFGLFANLVTVLAQSADEVSFADGRRYDEALLPKYQAALADPAPKKIIFVHLNGSHYEYKDRYPAEADYFNSSALTGKAALRAQYDNSIRYTDGVLKHMLDALKQHHQTAAFLYFSDHGEDVSGEESCFCHEEAQKTKEMYEVPFVLWVSPDYRRRHPNKVDEIRAQMNAPFNTQYLMETVIDLAGLSHPDVDTG